MADEPEPKLKPRIRKAAPTMRERAEVAQSKPEKRDSKLKGAISKIPLTNNPVWRVLRKFGGILSWLTPKYFINSWREVRQVTWPNRRETARLTLAVFVFAIIFGAAVAVVDKGLDEIFKKVILK